ncbi:unnamed protein product [Cercospora beticola]|nr:unnamed protein product [Cercospora beticola]
MSDEGELGRDKREQELQESRQKRDRDAKMATKWQDLLESYCREQKLEKPVYSIASDRRGGRTAWSAVVNLGGGQGSYNARYWYDGQFITNAKEDAAEVALIALGQVVGEGGKR